MMTKKSDCPFQEQHALNVQKLNAPGSIPSIDSGLHLNDALQVDYVPDRPEIPLSKSEIEEFLLRELGTPTLDFLYTRLWIAARRSGDHIDPLHLQKIRGRKIFACEQAKLHLIWVPKCIYVKPIPQCLLNHDFWTYFLPATNTAPQKKPASTRFTFPPKGFDRSIALGFIRSYAFLIQSPIDHKIAKDEGLIPESVTWLQWSTFIQSFRKIPDTEVAKRYHYGQIRMSRLHWLKRIYGAKVPKAADNSPRFFYETPLWSHFQYINAAFTPLLFLFATLSLVLSAMQVILTTPGSDNSLGGGLVYGGVQTIQRSSFVFSVIVELVVAFCWIAFLLIPMITLIWQLEFGFRKRHEPISHTPHK